MKKYQSVTAIVERIYTLYVEVDENATEEEIMDTTRNLILDDPSILDYTDIEMNIDSRDISGIYVNEYSEAADV